MLLPGRDRSLVEVRCAAATAVANLSWAGDLLVSTRALPAMLDALTPEAPRDDVSVLTRLADRLRVIVHDVFDSSLPGIGHAAPSPFGPAKMGLDEGGHPGQAVSCLVSDGAVIRGGYVATSVLGRGVVVDSGAEVEDCLLMDGCHIGRGAHLRRTIVENGPDANPEGRRVGPVPQ